MQVWTFKFPVVSAVVCACRPTDESFLAPSALAVSPLGIHIVSQSLRNPKEFGFHPYPSQGNGTCVYTSQCISLSLPLLATSERLEGHLQTFLSSQEIQSTQEPATNSSRETKLDLLDLAWDTLDAESSGGGSARWSMQYLQESMRIEM